MNRRGFLGAILAAGVAPAAIGSGVLMPIKRIALPAYCEILDPTIDALSYPSKYLYPMEIGRYQGVRFVESRFVHEFEAISRKRPMFTGVSSYQFNSK